MYGNNGIPTSEKDKMMKNYVLEKSDNIPDVWKEFYEKDMKFDKTEDVRKFLTYVSLITVLPEIKDTFDLENDGGILILKAKNPEFPYEICVDKIKTVINENGEVDIKSEYESCGDDRNYDCKEVSILDIIKQKKKDEYTLEDLEQREENLSSLEQEEKLISETEALRDMQIGKIEEQK